MELLVESGKQYSTLSIHVFRLLNERTRREAAQLLVDYAESQDDPSLEVDPPCSLTRSSQSPFTIIELGSGTGYVGLLIAKYLYRNGRRDDTVVLTDLPDVCALLEHNLGKAKGEIDFPNAFVAPLSWGNYEEAISLLDRLQNFGGRFPTHILCSDLVSCFFRALSFFT